jgi:hypothetical protein
MKIFDEEAYASHPGSNWVYNKLTLSEKLGYVCGPAGVKVPESGEYIIRPIMNLSGMGIKAKIVECKKGKTPTWEPGLFWCEVFKGRHISADFLYRKGERFTKFVSEGFNSKKELYKFTRWDKLEKLPEECDIPTWLDSTLNPNHCNVEFIDGKIIEVHLRHGTDFPENATTIIPIWKDSDQQEHHTWMSAGYTYIDNPDDADGHLDNPRVGFYYK